jgi:hypothetical protein
VCLFFADGSTHTAALLVGADGINSRVRRILEQQGDANVGGDVANVNAGGTKVGGDDGNDNGDDTNVGRDDANVGSDDANVGGDDGGSVDKLAVAPVVEATVAVATSEVTVSSSPRSILPPTATRIRMSTPPFASSAPRYIGVVVVLGIVTSLDPLLYERIVQVSSILYFGSVNHFFTHF